MNCDEYQNYCLQKLKDQREAKLKEAEPKILAISSMAKPYISFKEVICCEICGFHFKFYDDDKQPYLIPNGTAYSIKDEVDLGLFFEYFRKNGGHKEKKINKWWEFWK